MKNKILVITAILFFLVINTAYYWERDIGPFGIPVFLAMALIYISLVIALAIQIYLAGKEKLKNKRRLLTIGLLLIVLSLVFYRPAGLIDFSRFGNKDLLIAEREGAANCMTTFKLKDNFTFREDNVCFGTTEVSGHYHLQHDTIYFDEVNTGRYEDGFYKYAVIKPSKYYADGKHFDLTRYKSFTDTVGHDLWIVKNELKMGND